MDYRSILDIHCEQIVKEFKYPRICNFGYRKHQCWEMGFPFKAKLKLRKYSFAPVPRESINCVVPTLPKLMLFKRYELIVHHTITGELTVKDPL